MPTSKSPNRAASARADELREVFSGKYPRYQYRFVEFFADHLADLSRAFAGDLQAAMVLAIVGQVRLRAMRETLARGEKPGEALPGDGTTASRIADVTGIPRQTVRRKLLAMKARGWIRQDDDGRWRIVAETDGVTTPVRRDLAEFDRRAMARIARLVADLEELADR
jgi:CRP-like cAMP-binding protein